MGSKEAKKLIIDTDAGIDDAQAIMMALASPNVEVVAITTCHGNTDVTNVCRNVLRVLKLVDRLDIPVYNGCCKSLVGQEQSASHYHGLDGLGDVPDSDAPSVSLAQSEHAVSALVRLVSESPGELTLVALAPSTNIAMAIRMDPDFGKKLKNCFMMGGNFEGKGNITPCAEFNFHADPEAALITLKELECPIYLVCWELCLKHSLSWEWYEKFTNRHTKSAKFFKRIEANVVKNFYGDEPYGTADQIAMALVIAMDTVVKDIEQLSCMVETGGNHSRGMMIVNRPRTDEKRKNQTHKKTIGVITELYHNVYADLLMTATDF